MTKRTPAQPKAFAQRIASLALPFLLLSGCASVFSPTQPETSSGSGVSDAASPAASEPAGRIAEPVVTAGVAPGRVAEAAVETSVAAPTPIDPERPDVRIDIEDKATRVDLWQRLRDGFGMRDIDTDLVRDRERWYAGRPDYVARMTERGSRYLFYIVEELGKRNMPTELALLPFIESAFNPQAMSTARASGMWQFIPSTGRHYELRQNVFRDDRRDVLASTRAALDYLEKLHGMFDDWQLALAAYNWGEGSVQRAIARNQKAGLPTDYLSLRMPAETRLYLPKLQAIKNIVARPADFGLALPPLFNHPYFLAVPIEHDIDVAVATKLSDLPLEEFRSLNPQMNRPVILAAGTPQILLPYDNANRFVRELPRHRGPLATWTAWTAPKTMKTADAAKSVGMSEDRLREVNQIPSRMLVKAGSVLLVPRADSLLVDVSSHVADTATLSLSPDAPPLRKLTLKAGRRDSVASIATRYRISAAQVATWNGVAASARFKPGQTIIVYTAQKASKGKARGSGSKRADRSPPKAEANSTTRQSTRSKARKSR